MSNLQISHAAAKSAQQWRGDTLKYPECKIDTFQKMFFTDLKFLYSIVLYIIHGKIRGLSDLVVWLRYGTSHLHDARTSGHTDPWNTETVVLRKRRISGLQMGISIRLVMTGEEQRMVQTLSENEGAKRQSSEYHRDKTKNNRFRQPELRKDRGGEKQGWERMSLTI